MKYAVNEEGIEAMNTMASAITESVEELEGYTTTVQSAADEYEDITLIRTWRLEAMLLRHYVVELTAV